MTEQEPEVETEELRLARVFFVLPEPISLPDGYQIVMVPLRWWACGTSVWTRRSVTSWSRSWPSGSAY